MTGWLGFLGGVAVGAGLAFWLQARRLRQYGEMLAFMVHEVNTPLTSLHLGLMNFLEGAFGGLSKEHEGWMNILKEQSFRLGFLLADLRDYVHMEFQRDLAPNFEDVSLEQVLADVVSQAGSSFVRSKINLEISAEKDLPKARIDKDQIQRVIGNLLANIRKFQLGGSIRVRIESGRVQSEPIGRLRLIFTYQGPKLRPEEVRHATEILYPIQSRQKKEVLPCVGLGLGFCRALINSQGGSLSLIVGEGGESRLEVSLPAAPVSGTIQ